MRYRILRALTGLSMLIALIAPAVAARLGGEFLVSGKALNSSIAPVPGGGFVVVWRGDDPNFAILGQRYTASGARVGGNFIVAPLSREKVTPVVAALALGGFVVTWDSADPSGLGAWVQRFNADATKAGSRFRANTFTAGDQFGPTITGLKNGTFVVMWTSNGQASSDSAVFGQRFSKLGAKLGGEFRVDSTLPAAFHQFPSVAALASGGFVAVWRGYNGTYGRRFAANGTRVGGEFRVNNFIEGLLQHPVVAALNSGGFVVAREIRTSNLDVVGQRYASNGAKAGAAFRVNAITAGEQYDPAVAALSNGGFVIVFSDGTAHLARGRLYGANGAALANDFRINVTDVPIDAQASVGPLANGGFVATWQGSAPNSTFAVRGQRFDGR